MGAVVAYEALTGSDLRFLLEEKFGPQPDEARFDGKPRLHFVSIGNALNIAWTIAGDDEVYRFQRPLPSFIDWLNLWTYQDPYARQALRPPESTLLARPSLATPAILRPVRDYEVVNQQDIFSDHSAYWNNVAQVLSPVLNILTGGQLADHLKLDVRARIARVRVLSFFKALSWLIAPAVFISLVRLGETPGIARSAIDEVSIQLATAAIEFAPSWLGLTEADLAENVMMPFVVALVAAAIVVVLYSTAVKWAWDLWDSGSRFNQPE
jgi:hypothetical protein